MTRFRRDALVLFVALLVAICAREGAVQASDAELTTDFSVPPWENASNVDGNYFTYTGLRGGVPTKPGTINSKKVTVNEFPALEGLGISYILMYFQPGGVLAPHIHPRGSKLVYVIEGTLDVGFVDTNYKNYNQTLVEGDVYVIPKAMVHYMANLKSDKMTKVIFSFSSSNPGIFYLPEGLFGARPGIPEQVLGKSFGVSENVLHGLETSYIKL